MAVRRKLGLESDTATLFTVSCTALSDYGSFIEWLIETLLIFPGTLLTLKYNRTLIIKKNNKKQQHTC